MSTGSAEKTVPPGPTQTRESEGIAGDFFALLSGNIGRILVSILTVVLLARLFVPSELAKYSLFQMFNDLAVTFAGTWTSAAVVRFGREELLQHASLRRTFWSRGLIVVLSAVVLLTVATFFRTDFQHYTSLPAWVFWFLLAVVVTNVTIEYANYVFQATGAFRSSAGISFFQKFAFLLGAGLVFLGVFHAAVETILLFVGISALVTVGVSLPLVRRELFLPPIVDRVQIGRILKFSYPALISSGSLYVINWVDIVVIKAVVGTDGVGIYHISYTGFLLLCSMGITMNTLFLPKMVSLRVQEKESGIRLYLEDGIPLILILWGAVLSVGALFVPWAVPAILGKAYAFSAQPLVVLMLASFFQFTSMALASIITAYDLMLPIHGVNIATAAINVGLDLLLVPALGIIGAAWSTAIAFMFNAAGCLYLATLPLHGRTAKHAFAATAIIPIVVLALTRTPVPAAITLVFSLGCAVIATRRFRFVSPGLLEALGAMNLPSSIRTTLERILHGLSP